MVEYDPRQVRNVLRDLSCTEVITADENIRYFQNGNGLAQLHMNEKVEESQIEIICENLGHDLPDFKERLKLDKKHKKQE